ncbi:ferritin [Flavobacterium sp. GSP27]|uniref:Ferritin n=1 Tax=Flavobacterium bomense TaxID=2497483 RepID=A0A432CR03_9FLAO|nr:MULTISPECIES: ferritin [Flavobacterium]RTY96440.1 ferritin [Flavobacterium sp. GSN2]RTY70452.1 ferritin [Flavobacterium sp. LB2P53]RTY76256.1 ferritin [Flavobacterium sp. LS1R10]RTY81357.1 ferritin [Flavobacterium sp. ZB4P23]RTY85152.1 ferritin [Flavobacterium sp. LS1P28]
MLSKNIEIALNKQIRIEAESSQTYLSMACWAEVSGLEGIAQFMFAQSDEERLHMLKLIKYVNERGSHAKITDLKAPKTTYETFKDMFEELYKHEIFVSDSINELVHITFSEKDYATHNFLQWYVAEQIEEEATAKSILDKINLIGDDKGGLYLFDRDLQQVALVKPAI